jgi:hypothetical protein
LLVASRKRDVGSTVSQGSYLYVDPAWVESTVSTGCRI